MAARRQFISKAAMATRFRRRRMCVLIADVPSPAALRQVSGSGAFLETNARPELGRTIELHHPEAGRIAGVVSAVAHDGIGVAFEADEGAVAFALAAITADMSRPAA